MEPHPPFMALYVLRVETPSLRRVTSANITVRRGTYAMQKRLKIKPVGQASFLRKRAAKCDARAARRLREFGALVTIVITKIYIANR
jgi:hypothetical protein